MSGSAASSIKDRSPNFIANKRGFTFIELMLTITIFSAGFITIIQILSVSLDRLSHLTYRIYAVVQVENTMSEIERSLRANKTLPFDVERTETVQAGSRTLMFDQSMKIVAIDNFLDLFRLDFELSWKEGQTTKLISRSAYIADMRLEE